MAICFLNISNGQYTENKSEDIICTLKAADIKKMIGNKSGSVYNRLSEVATEMTTNVIRVQDTAPDAKKFVFIPLFSKVEYSEKEGEMSIAFNHYLKDYLINYSMNFTTLGIDTMLSFKSIYGYRLYEHLKARAYHPKKSKNKENNYEIFFDLSELMFDLGVYDATDPVVKKMLESEKPDWNEALKVLKTKAGGKKSSYDSYGEFNRSVLSKAVKEVNQRSDLDIYKIEPKCSGHGGKVNSIIFHVKYKTLDGDNDSITFTQEESFTESSIILDNEKLDLLDEIHKILSKYDLKLRDSRLIAEIACYDLDKINKAVAVVENYKGEITNLVGFLKIAIEKDFEPGISKKTNKNTKGNTFTNFTERGSDYNDIAQAIMSSQKRL